MILIADSGSTKTLWCLVKGSDDTFESCTTQGINPWLQNENDITEKLVKEFTLSTGRLDAVYFYGAGCANPEKNDQVRRPLKYFFNVKDIFIYSDIMAAARALCVDKPGIAAILGTGSNSCHYDGSRIISQVSPLGFILGDEGSGAALGRRLISDVLKKQLPENICNLFFDRYRLKPDDIMDNVYHKPFPNRFMAKFAPFLSENINHPSIYQLVNNCFKEFFKRNIEQYPESAHLPVNATGSIAWHFRSILKESAAEKGFRMEVITRSPMDGLVKFHQKDI